MAPSGTLKRSAPSSSSKGAKPKKINTGNENAGVEKTGKRSRPVTRPVQEEDENSSEEEGDLEEADVIPEDEEMGEEEGLKPSKDPNGTLQNSFRPLPQAHSIHAMILSATRESHQAQRLLHLQRRAAKPHSALLTEAKHAWSLARQKNLSKTDRTKNVKALMDIVRGHVKDIVFKHDASRIVQTVVKYGSAKERNEIAVELKGQYQALAQNKYSKVRRCAS